MDNRFADGLIARFSDLLSATTARLETRIDGLAAQLTEFRAATEENYDTLRTRFDGLESRFDGLDLRFNAFETRFTRFEAQVYLRFDGLEERLAFVEGR